MTSLETQVELIRRPDTTDFMRSVDRAYNAMNNLGYFKSAETINNIIALIICKLIETGKWQADKPVTAATIKESKRLIHNELYAANNELYTAVYTYFDLLHYADSDDGELALLHIDDDAEDIAQTYHKLFD